MKCDPIILMITLKSQVLSGEFCFLLGMMNSDKTLWLIFEIIWNGKERGGRLSKQSWNLIHLGEKSNSTSRVGGFFSLGRWGQIQRLILESVETLSEEAALYVKSFHHSFTVYVNLIWFLFVWLVGYSEAGKSPRKVILLFPTGLWCTSFSLRTLCCFCTPTLRETEDHSLVLDQMANVIVPMLLNSRSLQKNVTAPKVFSVSCPLAVSGAAQGSTCQPLPMALGTGLKHSLALFNSL